MSHLLKPHFERTLAADLIELGFDESLRQLYYDFVVLDSLLADPYHMNVLKSNVPQMKILFNDLRDHDYLGNPDTKEHLFNEIMSLSILHLYFLGRQVSRINGEFSINMINSKPERLQSIMRGYDNFSKSFPESDIIEIFAKLYREKKHYQLFLPAEDSFVLSLFP